MKLNFQKLGSGSPIFIVHGLFGSGDNWVTVAKTLAEKYTVYLPDQRNHGRSPHDEEHTYAAMAQDLAELIADEKIENPVLVGHSMGGKTVMHYAVNEMGPILKPVIVDIAPKYYPVHHRSIIDGLKAVKAETLTSRNDADVRLSGHIPHPTVRQFLLKNLYRTDSGTFAWRMNLDVLDRKIENVGEGLAEGDIYTEDILFIRGQQSDYIQDSDMPLIHRHFPRATLQTVSNAGHWIQAEQPEAFLKILTEFIEK